MQIQTSMIEQEKTDMLRENECLRTKITHAKRELNKVQMDKGESEIMLDREKIDMDRREAELRRS